MLLYARSTRTMPRSILRSPTEFIFKLFLPVPVVGLIWDEITLVKGPLTNGPLILPVEKTGSFLGMNGPNNPMTDDVLPIMKGFKAIWCWTNKNGFLIGEVTCSMT